MRMLGRLARSTAAIALVALVAAPAALAVDGTVTIRGSAFHPGAITVSVGDSVTWTNTEVASHTATADGGAFDTGTIATGRSRTVTFSSAGTIPYHCAIHPDMTGSIVVAAAVAPSPTIGDAVSATPAPTDTVAPIDVGGDPVAAVLVVLGLSMLLGTFIADRRLAYRDRKPR